MEYYKKYRIIENISLTESINHFIDFVHRIPLLGKLTGDKYKLYGFKKLVYILGPIFSLMGQIIKSMLSFVLCIIITGSIIWSLNKLGIYRVQEFEDLMDYGVVNLAFLSFYLTPALVSNNIEGRKLEIHKLNKQYRMEAKESGLVLGVFDPLRISFGRAIIFWIILGFKKALIISLSLAFIRISTNTYNLYMSFKKEKKLSDRFSFFIVLAVILFALLMQLKSISIRILIPIFLLSLVIFIVSIRYLLKFDGYDRLLELAKKESANIELDFDKIANDSLALKDSDIEKDKKTKGRGYELLNNLFFQRHSRLLIKPVFKKALIIFAIILALLFGVKFIFTRFASFIEGIFILALPIITMIIYNDTESARAFFLNCDRSLMQYGFYRDPKAIFDMYKLRYISLLKIQFIELASTLISLITYYFLYQNIDIETGLLAGGFIVVSYLFFPAFNLFNYYVFQPFNQDASAKGGLYKFINSLIGYVNILIIPAIMGRFDGDMNVAFIALIVIMLILIIIFPFVVKKHGKNTFKIRK
ncbi:hypothetical protein [Anaerococcus urinomassiliensis]|uniref:hypothetical protein n=1 Tax=Anaerococcus urinomassiliensis TaxID=1745712 RepID=UPI00093E3FBD|nr:hypothetical protein [Anaerococcus urinomassiliensis]